MFPILRRRGFRFPRHFDDIERVFDTFLHEPRLWTNADNGLSMPLDVIEKEKEIVVRAELPGVDRNDIEIRLENNILTIRGEKHHEAHEETDNYHLLETSCGTFARAISLPSDVDAESVNADFDKGVLTVTLPKTEQAKSRQIKVT